MSLDIDRVVFVGVIHTDIDSVKHVRKVVKEVRPDVVAVELDRERYAQLTFHGRDDPRFYATSGNSGKDSW